MNMDGFKRIGMDEKFRFHCNGCGDCCRNRDDIYLSPSDLFKMSKHQRMDPKDFSEKYCIMSSSHVENFVMPAIYLKPEHKLFGYVFTGSFTNGTDKGNLIPVDTRDCPFIGDDNLCKMEEAKPTVCRLFPLGRFVDRSDDPPRVEYIVSKYTCGVDDGEEHSVVDWLESMRVTDEAHFLEYSLNIAFIARNLSKLFDWFSHEEDGKEFFYTVYSIVGSYLYTAYDIDSEFQEQYRRNMDSIHGFLEDMIYATTLDSASRETINMVINSTLKKEGEY